MDIYLDFEGTVLDVSEKYYRLYYDLIIKDGGRPLRKRAYWFLKVAGAEEEEIYLSTVPRASGQKRRQYLREWQDLLEDDRYLKFDTLFAGTEAVFSLLKKTGHQLFLFSWRKNEFALQKQIKSLNLINCFDEILTGKPSAQKDGEILARMINSRKNFEAKKSVIVGDTELEILAGKSLAIPTVAVLTGLRSQSFLERFEPDFILGSLEDLPRVVRILPGDEYE